MPQEPSRNTAALRSEFAAQLSKVVDKIGKEKVAKKLQVTRQMLNRYLRAKSTPGGEVIKRACDEWQLTLSVRGFEFKAGAFEVRRKRESDVTKAAQLSLIDLLAKIKNEQLQAKIVRREGDSFYVELRIRVVA